METVCMVYFILLYGSELHIVLGVSLTCGDAEILTGTLICFQPLLEIHFGLVKRNFKS